MRLQISVLVGSVCALWGSAAFAQATLPLTKVRLYETGVAYFERHGTLAGGAGARLPVPAGHLDDALKTLVVLSPDGTANVGGVEFASSVSPTMARALAGLPEEGEAGLGMKKLLDSLKGANVEVKSARGAHAGRVVEVIDASQSDLSDCVEVQKVAGNGHGKNEAGETCVPTRRAALMLLGKNGEIVRVAVGEIASVKPTDAAVAARLGSAVDALSHRGAQARRELRVLAKSGRGVALGYIAETPVWRSTYRLVLDKADRGMLQGWALVHNDTDEDWKQVKVELVNGRPDSFLFPLAAPRYARRELVTPENELSTVPQLLDTTVDAMWSGEGAGGMGLTGTGEGGGGTGYGIGLGQVGTIGHGAGAGSGSASSSLLNVGNLAAVAGAEGVEAGALFQYALARPIDLRARGSALVPFASESLKARRIAWFSAPGQTAKSGVHLTNEGKQTLPPGPIAIFADGGFAGETAIDRLKPKEARLLSFGLDLDVELGVTRQSARDETRVLGFDNDHVVVHYVKKHEIDYQVENRSGSARTVYLTLPFVNNAKVEGADEIGFDAAAGKAFAVFRIAARSKQSWKLRADEGLRRGIAFKTLGSARLKQLAAAPGLSAAQRAIVLRAADRLTEAEVRRGGMKRRGAELAELESDIARLRENVRAVSNGQSAKPLVDRLIAAEDRAKGLRRRLRELRSEADERVRQARKALAALD